MFEGQKGEGALQLLTHQVFMPASPVQAPIATQSLAATTGALSIQEHLSEGQ